MWFLLWNEIKWQQQIEYEAQNTAKPQRARCDWLATSDHKMNEGETEQAR